MQPVEPRCKGYHSVTLWFVVISVTWILLSDRVSAALVHEAAAMAWVQSMKGSLYVLSTAVVLFLLGRAAHEREWRRIREKHAVYDATVAGAYHILANYVHASQIITLTAEATPGFDRDVLVLAEQARREAEGALARLRDLQDVQADSIRSAVRPVSSTPPS